MTTYNTYQDAKIANPGSEIFTNKDKSVFQDIKNPETSHFANGWEICNPADHCMTLEKFLADGYKFDIGDLWLDFDGDVMEALSVGLVSLNTPHEADGDRYILRAKALEDEVNEEIKIGMTCSDDDSNCDDSDGLMNEKSPRGIISRISNRLHNIGCEFQDGEFGDEFASMACEMWGALKYISNEEIETESQRIERERLEAAYHLCKISININFGNDRKYEFDEFKRDDRIKRLWLAIVDETKYTKGK